MDGLKVIGVFAVCHTGWYLCTCHCDHTGENVLASMNGRDRNGTPITEQPLSEITGEERMRKLWSRIFLLALSLCPSPSHARVNLYMEACTHETYRGSECCRLLYSSRCYNPGRS
jgi:hypothetical protein